MRKDLSARSLGAYYTPSAASLYMAGWALRSPSDRILEPSMGDGQFLQALSAVASQRGSDGPQIWGVELARDTYQRSIDQGLISRDRAYCRDFLAVAPFPVDVAIGNPPYVRLRHLPVEEARRAGTVSSATLGEPMDPSGSIWMPFLLHALRFVADGGRLAFVLPFEVTHVRYARPLWRHLAKNVGHLRVVRVHERVFPEILQDVVLLFADQRGRSTRTVVFELYDRAVDLTNDRPALRSEIDLGSLMEGGSRPFVEATLPAELRELLHTKVHKATDQARSRVTFNIGYVTGDKDFFHPKPDTIEKFRLGKASLQASVAASRHVSRAGLWTSKMPAASTTNLFVPPRDTKKLSDGDRLYIAHGKAIGVDARYKCRVRKPWYVTPAIRVPDVLLSVFSERPQLVVNDAGYLASNSLLCGYLIDYDAERLAAEWYTSLTLLQAELNVHALGGGVMVFVPNEASAIKLPRYTGSLDHLERVHSSLTSKDPDQPFLTGDRTVLPHIGLTANEIELLREGVATLRHWRRAHSPADGRHQGASELLDQPGPTRRRPKKAASL